MARIETISTASAVLNRFHNWLRYNIFTLSRERKKDPIYAAHYTEASIKLLIQLGSWLDKTVKGISTSSDYTWSDRCWMTARGHVLGNQKSMFLAWSRSINSCLYHHSSACTRVKPMDNHIQKISFFSLEYKGNNYWNCQTEMKLAF